MGWLSDTFWLAEQGSRATPRSRCRLSVETLEDRTLLSIFYVEPLGYPINSTHLHTLQDALGAATDGDTIIIEPSATISSIGAKPSISSLGAAATAGATTVTST